MKKIIILISILCLSGIGFAQNNNIFIRKEDNPELKVTIDAYFGISLMTQYNGFIRYGYIQIKSTGETKITYLSQQQFMQQVTGQMISKANPNKINYLEQKVIMWQSFENLWKIRYAEYPYDGPNKLEKGWAGRDMAPSEAQWKFLKQYYGYSNFDQFLYGENMWKLVKDSQDPAWQSQYSSLK
jgi:hypothetical protein